jgi:metal-responsive CopG/Arc/MetJ family transcriptional regulator
MPTPIDIMQARLPKGTIKRIDKVLKGGGEQRSHFLRTAVENELRRREGALKRREPLEPAQQLEAAE